MGDRCVEIVWDRAGRRKGRGYEERGRERDALGLCVGAVLRSDWFSGSTDPFVPTEPMLPEDRLNKISKSAQHFF